MGSRCSKPVEQIKRKKMKMERLCRLRQNDCFCVTTIHIYVFIITLFKKERNVMVF